MNLIFNKICLLSIMPFIFNVAMLGAETTNKKNSSNTSEKNSRKKQKKQKKPKSKRAFEKNPATRQGVDEN